MRLAGTRPEWERLFELSRELLSVTNSEARFVRVNPAWTQRLGWTGADLIGRPYLELVHPEDREATAAEAGRLVAGQGDAVEFENRYRHRDGSYRWLAWNLCRPDGGLIYAAARVATPRHRVHSSLWGSEAFYRTVVESSDDAIITKDTNAIITSWNHGAERLYGYTSAEAVGRPIGLIIPPERGGEEFRILETVLGGQRIEHYETTRVTKQGETVPVSLSVSGLRDEQGDVVGAVAISRDISERKQMERQLRYLADHDMLTGLYNRRYFESELGRRARHAARYRRPGAVLLIDLDDFKLVNDSFGHQEGDAVLRRVAGALSDRLRETDILARLGGDEFGILLDEVDLAQTTAVARELLDSMSTTHRGPTTGASIGIAPLRADQVATLEGVMGAADIALYHAKNSGRNQVAVYSGGRKATLCSEPVASPAGRGTESGCEARPGRLGKWRGRVSLPHRRKEG